MERDRNGIEAPVLLRGIGHRRRGEVGEIEVRRGHRRIGQERAQVQQPMPIADQTFLRGVGDVADIHAGVAGRKLDHQFLAELLFRNLLGADRDAGQRRKILFVLLQVVGEGGALQRDLDVLALETLPVEGVGGAHWQGVGGDGGRGRTQHRAAPQPPVGPCGILLHLGFLPIGCGSVDFDQLLQ